MARLQFDSLFTSNADGSIVARENIRIGGVTLPKDYVIQPGSVVGGIDLTQYKGHELEVVTDSGAFVITAIY